uniref:ANK_REP_REGION domain-containing protein n=1 Tax=Macrostomum lignano TaxID=282301 RepID=A0A1I8H0W7_9PLAT
SSDPTAFHQPGRLQRTAIHWAARNEATNSCLKWLVQQLGRSCLLKRGFNGITAAHVAAQYQDVETLSFIVDLLGVSVLDLRDASHFLPWKRKSVADYAKLNSQHGSQLTRWIAERRHQQRSQSEKTPTVPLHEDFYQVTNPQGFCLIININTYSTGSGEEERKGSERDVDRVRKLFRKLSFTIKEVQNPTTAEIDDFLNETKKSKELAKHGSFVCFLMAHGRKDAQGRDCIIDGHGVQSPVLELAAKFKASVCPDLAGKPKIFFVQACRGSGTDEVTHRGLAVDQLPPEFAQNPALYPPESDFLFCFPTTEGQVSYRDPQTGSVFVQTLCDYIEQFYMEKHLEDIMILVRRHMAEKPYEFRNERGEIIKYYCVAQTVSQLARQVSFDPSKAQKRSRSLQLFSLGSH